ncbi:RNA-guided endonuclease InsQ/TnpB family protein [Scopulibacillus cellulosilyticus]|uniref:RNA-guided endonuclease InsQ/TnpB family protein n=1 Tax=Scopulibacillus cellulosilyticus TaxID=2665665 RepID=A0ABW2Q0S5_9BACL
MKKTYKFKLEPSKQQADKMDWTLTMCRQLYNVLLEQRIFAYKKRHVSVNYYEQKKELPLLKLEIPEYKQVQSQVLQDVVKRLNHAFQAFFRRLETNQKAGFPRFQGRNRYDSFTYPQSGFSLNGKFLKLSKIGDVRIKCHRQIKGRIKTCTIRRKNNKWYACFSCEVEAEMRSTGKEVGVDLGVAHLAITSDGKFFDNHRYLKQSERKIRYWNKGLSRRKKGSYRWHKARLQLSKVYEQLTNRRNDRAHKVSRQLVDQYDLIAFEALDIQGMVKNRQLSKHILDAAWRLLIQYTTYKAEEAGKRVIQVNPQNTSQECSNCHQIVPKSLNERTHRCLNCRYTEHRDVNAARNILQRAKDQLETAS